MNNPTHSARSRAYRADIDGLRAVAVLFVVFDHLKLRLLGGYIGVDVFFVISGYLISSVIIAEMDAGRFSIVNFYERRIRRIFPALLVMLLVTTLLVYRYFVPSETIAYARSMLAAAFSVSNILFWSQSGYFDQPSTYKPLLHTWSLAVEEQFYIVFPLFLMAVRRWASRHMKQAIIGVAIVTLILACWWTRHDASTAFFLAPLRAWELLVGTILSQRYFPAISGRAWRNLAATSGLLLIFVPGVLYAATTPFPGLAAIPPCLGAALVIAAGETGSSIVGRVLCWRPIVFIGLISYSLYLWHWPLIVFQTTNSMLVTGHAGGRRVPLVCLLASFLAATLSWRYIETPFRAGPLRLSRMPLFLLNGAVAGAISAIALLMMGSGGMPSRFPSEALAVSRYTDFDTTEAYRVHSCFLMTRAPFSEYQQDVCLKLDPSRPDYLLLGDSHAAQLYYGLLKTFPELNITQATIATCKSWADPPADERNTACGKMSDFLYGHYLLQHHVAAVLLSGRWDVKDMSQLGDTLSWYHQHHIRVILIGPNVEFDASLPRILATSLRDRDTKIIDRHYMPELFDLDKQMSSLARNTWHVPYISSFEDICGNQVEMVAQSQPETSSGCPVYASLDVPLLIDADHFGPAGSLLFAKAIRAAKQLP